MKLAIISPVFPYRGGISNEMQLLCEEFLKEEFEFKVFNFVRLYPQILFPGKNQLIEENIFKKNIFNDLRIIDSINPITWNKTAKLIIKGQYDKVLFRYWHPFFIPMYNFIKNKIKKNNKNVKFVCICDNVFPHERFPFDNSLIKIFFKNIDGFLTMSSHVENQIKKIRYNAKIKRIFLPIKTNFGPSIFKEDAVKEIGIKNKFVILFFGLIRNYKGLDILLKSLKILNNENLDFKLLIVGECYEKKRKYLKLIDELKLTKKIIWIDEYIPNSKINLYFSACDLVALPYKKASQSGIIPIAYNYNKLVVASDIEGLNEYVINNETGYLFKNKNFNSLASILKNIYFNHDFEISDNNIRKYKKEFSTKKLIQEIISFI